MGKKSSVKWAVKIVYLQVKNLKFYYLIEIDALIHFEENMFVHRFLSELNKVLDDK